jgi:2,5-diketo-D-gluconate reductase A
VTGPGPAPTRTLNDGHEIPLLGLGTYPLNGAAGAAAVAGAIGLGYRLVDTAAKYDNEVAVGRGLRESGVPREELYVTTKLRGSEQGPGTRDALLASLERLGLDYVDLYLIHWPLPRLDRYVTSYEVMLELRREGLVRSVGVSNFTAAHLDRLAPTGVVPAVDQIQLSPTVARTALVGELAARGIVPQAYTPLGRGAEFGSDVVARLAAAYGRTPAQIVLRWHVQRGIVAIPKSGDPDRQRANLDVFDFALTDDELAQLSALDRGEAAAIDADRHEEF